MSDKGLAARAGLGWPLAIEVESYFRFLDVDIRVVSDSVRQMQYWEAIYSAFSIHPTEDPQVVIEAHGDGSAGSLTGVVTTRDGRFPWATRGQLLPPLDLPLFDRWVHLHGSIVSRGGHGVLVVGTPKTGKTAISLAGVARGALLVADGIVPVAVDDLLAHPFPRSLRLRREELDLLGLNRSHPALRAFRTQDAEVQWRADPRALLRTRSARTATEIAAIAVLPGPDAPPAPEPVLIPMPAYDALAVLIRHLRTPPARRRRAVDGLVRLASGVPSYVLHPGTPHATAAVLDGLL